MVCLVLEFFGIFGTETVTQAVVFWNTIFLWSFDIFWS